MANCEDPSANQKELKRPNISTSMSPVYSNIFSYQNRRSHFIKTSLEPTKLLFVKYKLVFYFFPMFPLFVPRNCSKPKSTSSAFHQTWHTSKVCQRQITVSSTVPFLFFSPLVSTKDSGGCGGASGDLLPYKCQFRAKSKGERIDAKEESVI